MPEFAYADFQKQTTRMIREFGPRVFPSYTFQDLAQESWIAFLETDLRYTPESAAHFFSLYRKVLLTRFAKILRSVIGIRAGQSLDVDEDEEAVAIPHSDEIDPAMQAVLDDLPFDYRLMLQADLQEDGGRRDFRDGDRRTTDEILDAAAGYPGASRLIREAMLE